MAVSETEFQALKAQVSSLSSEFLTIKNAFAILENTVNSQYAYVTGEIDKIKVEIEKLKAKDTEILERIGSNESFIEMLRVQDESNKILINRINRERKGLI